MTQLPILLIICVSCVYSAKYSVTLERLEQCPDSSDNPYVDLLKFELKQKKGKTVGIKHGDLSLLEDIGKDVKVHVKLYKKLFYYWVPIFSISKKVCKFIKSDKMFYPVFLKLIKLPEVCPLTKGAYVLEDITTVIKSMPSFIPRGCVRLDLTISGKAGSGCLRIYVTINDPDSSKVHVCKV